MRFPPRKRPFLVGADEPAVPCHVGCDYRREPPFCFLFGCQDATP